MLKRIIEKPTIEQRNIMPIANGLFRTVGIIHFIGIGGIGMSGIAEILHNLGYKVQGSDMAVSGNVTRLREMGISVAIGHAAANIGNAAVIVKSSAVKDNNPEIIEARQRHIPVVKRAEMLAELMRLKTSIAIAGTHGKTTTTSLVASMFEAANLHPTVINGGIINSIGTNAYLGSGEYLIAEADESDGTFIKVPSCIAVITNIDPEHLDYYGNFDALRTAFRSFVQQLPFYGFAILCKDHPEVEALIPLITDRKIITYGLCNGADVKAVNIRKNSSGSVFDVEIADRTHDKVRVLKDVILPMPGIHNVQNSLSAIAIALELKFDENTIIEGFKHFGGVKRRFTKTGEAGGITVIDDYGHHPKEIEATLKTARDVVESGRKVIAVVQPHRYSRVNDLFSDFTKCFSNADTVLVADIYSAGEEPIPGITRDVLVASIRQAGRHPDVRVLESPAQLASTLHSIAGEGDFIICLGAGNITAWAASLPGELAQLQQAAVA
jgi:UDP-N-acetylmuramate--alanine ligase